MKDVPTKSSSRNAIDFAQAHLVAEAFLEEPRTSHSDFARAAYVSLGDQAERWFDRVTGGSIATPIRVVYTRCEEPYGSGAELSERVRSEGLLELFPASQDPDRAHPSLDMSVGGTYDRFRAVHDIVSHAWHGYEFDRHGEFAAWLAEDRMYCGLARWALATELHAEHSVRWTTGHVPEHKATVLEPGVLRRSWLRGLRIGHVGSRIRSSVRSGVEIPPPTGSVGVSEYRSE